MMILKDGKVLLGRRRGSHGRGEYASPGGHLEYGESFEDCARREVREETGLEIDNVRFQFVSNVLKYRPKHYVHIGLAADWLAGEPTNNEPDKCEGWAWYGPDELPERLFETTHQAFQSDANGTVFMDSESKPRGGLSRGRR